MKRTLYITPEHARQLADRIDTRTQREAAGGSMVEQFAGTVQAELLKAADNQATRGGYLRLIIESDDA